MRWVALAPGALFGALLGYTVVYFALVLILQVFGDPAPTMVRIFVTRFWASTTFAGFALIVAEGIAPAGRDQVSKWAGGVLLATAVALSALGMAMRDMSDLACAAGLVIGTFMTWAAEKRWR